MHFGVRYLDLGTNYVMAIFKQHIMKILRNFFDTYIHSQYI